MTRKQSFLSTNAPIIKKYCEDNGLEFNLFEHGHYRIFGPVAIVDIWASRMTYRIVNIDGVEQRPIYHHDMRQKINVDQLKQLLDRGWVTK